MLGGRITLPAEPVNQARARFDSIFSKVAPLLPPPDDSVSTTDVIVPSSKQRVRVFTPNRTNSLLPVGLYIHSGGWYAGSIENEDFLCRNVAANSQIILYSPEYRLSPEDPYPAGLQDIFAAYEFMHENASTYGGNPAQKFIMGGSAGGNLTAAVALRYATSVGLKPCGLCIFVPPTCEPTELPETYRARYTPEMYVDSPVIGNEILKQARGKPKSRAEYCSSNTLFTLDPCDRMVRCSCSRSLLLSTSPSRHQTSAS